MGKSQFEGYVYQELGLDVVEKIESPDFNQFIQLAEGCIEILEPEFLKTDNRYPEWYKIKSMILRINLQM